MAAMNKKEKQKRCSEMSSEEIEKYFKARGIDINEEIKKIRSLVLLYKRIFEDEKNGEREKTSFTEKANFTEARTLKRKGGKEEEKEKKASVSGVEYRMACNGTYGEDGANME